MKRNSVIFYAYGIIAFVLAVIFLSDIHIQIANIYAGEEFRPKRYKYYTSIEIRNGDTLWSIACQYADEEYISVPEYIDELKNMNHLTSDQLVEGHYLTIMYYSDHYK